MLKKLFSGRRFMALVRNSVGLGDISGKAGGGVFAKNKGGAYVRKMTKPTNPRSVAQMAVRNKQVTNSQTWRSIPQTARNGWAALAAQVLHSNRLGEKKNLSGFGLYCQINNTLAAAGQTLLVNPPAFGSITNFLTATLAVTAATPLLTLTFAPAIPAGQVVLLSATPPLSAGITFAKTRFRQIGILASTDTSPKDITALYVALFGTGITAGQKIFFKATPVVKLTGQRGSPIQGSAIAA